MRLAMLPYYVRRVRSARMSEPYWRLASGMRHWKQKRSLRKDTEAFSIDRCRGQIDRWLNLESAKDRFENLNSAVRGRLPAEWWQARSFWKEFSRVYPEPAEQIVARAESSSAGRFTLFQWKEFDPGNVPWSSTLDETRPDDGWPAKYYSEVRFYSDPNRPEQDVKWCWELNRFQHLLCLGAAWRITGDNRFAARAKEQIESWMDAVPYPFGVQWSSNLEVALRALSWARCHVLCMGSASWDDDFMARFLSCLYIHVRHLDSELSLDHATGNHLLGESAALLHLSIMYEPFSRSDRWRTRSLRILGWLVPKLILSDGVYAEQSTGYFRFVSEFLLPLIHLARVNGIRLPDVAFERLAAGLKFVQALSPRPDRIPMIGDSDTGFALGWQIDDYWDFSALFAMGAAILDEPGLYNGIETYPAEAFLLLGPVGLDSFQAGSRKPRAPQNQEGEGSPDSTGLRCFPSGGYQVSADGSFHIVFDGGPLGIYPGFGHGHADGLSFVLFYNGVPAIVDPGTCWYNGPPLWREYFRSTLAHNTIRVDGGSQSNPIDTFRWSRPPDICLHPPKEGKGWQLLSGQVKWGRLVHHRFILHLIGQGLIVLDYVNGKGEPRLEWSLHWSPEWSLTQLNNTRFSASSDSGSLAGLLLQPDGAQMSILCGSENPIGGWYSRLYGLKTPAPNLRGSVSAGARAGYLMAIRPATGRLTLPADSPLLHLPEEIVGLVHSEEFARFAEP